MLESSYWGNPARLWLIALGVFLLGSASLVIARRVLVSRLRRIAQRTTTDWDDLALDMVERTRLLFLLLLAAVLSARLLVLPPAAARALEMVVIVMVAVQTATWGNGIIAFGIARAIRVRGSADGATTTTLSALGFFARALLWIVILALALDNLGFEVSALLTGLGIGGVAVALAVQNILGDLFAALSIVLDKPFVVGDTIHIDNFVGTVEHVGVKTTRLRSITGEQIIIGNADLLKGRIRNYKRMQERRVQLFFGVVYGTAADDIAMIPGIVRQIVDGIEGTRFDRCHFYRFGESSLDFEAVYWILNPDYGVFMDRQQDVNLALMRALAGRKIDFAFPTRTVHVAPGELRPRTSEVATS